MTKRDGLHHSASGPADTTQDGVRPEVVQDGTVPPTDTLSLQLHMEPFPLEKTLKLAKQLPRLRK